MWLPLRALPVSLVVHLEAWLPSFKAGPVGRIQSDFKVNAILVIFAFNDLTMIVEPGE